MGLIFIAPVFVLACWIIVSAVRILKTNELDPIWKKRALVLGLIGLLLGVWLSFFAEFQPAANSKFSRAPIPTSVWLLEKEGWRQVPVPHAMQILAIITDFISGVAAGLFPIKAASFLKQARKEFGR